jgi:hypothetical protein
MSDGRFNGLTREDIIDIESIFIREHQDKPMPKGGFPELWYNVITRFLGWTGSVPPHIRDAEHLIMERELYAEYIEALKQEVKLPADATDEERLFHAIIASGPEREAALKKVFK